MEKVKNFNDYISEQSSFLGKAKEAVRGLMTKVGEWFTGKGGWYWNLIKLQDEGKLPKYIRGIYNYKPKPTEFTVAEEPAMESNKILFTNEGQLDFYSEIHDFLDEAEAWRERQMTQDREVPDASAPEFKESVEYQIDEPESRPLLIWGGPGVGKTSVVKQVAKERGIGCIDIILSMMEPTDVMGLPGISPDEKHPETSRTVYNLPMFFPLDNGNDDKGGILFFDELNRAHESVMNAMLKVILDREIKASNYKVPSKWVIIAAANRESDEPMGGITPMGKALGNRFKQINYIADPESWADWAKTANLPEEIINYILAFPDFFYTLDPKKKTTLYASPRSWEGAAREYYSKSIKAGKQKRELNDEEIHKIFQTHLGSTVASAVTPYIKAIKKIPMESIKLAFTDPQKAELPLKKMGQHEPNIMYAMIFLMSQYKKDEQLTEDEYGNFLEYITRWDGSNNAEMAQTALRTLFEKHPEIKSMKPKQRVAFGEKYKGIMQKD